MKDVILVELEARITVAPGARPDKFGWTVKIQPNEPEEKVGEAIAEAMRRLTAETKGKLL